MPKIVESQAKTPAGANAEKAADAAQLSGPAGVSKGVSSIALASQDLGAAARRTSSAAVALGTVDAASRDDTALMLRVKAGDEAAFALLVERFRRPLIGFMYRMAHNQAVAEELAQEVFLRVYRSRQSYAASAKFSTWLYRVATNLALNHIRDTRNERAQAAVSLDEPEEESGRAPDVADARLNAEQKMLQGERMAAIRKCVEGLPERQRAAVIMHKYQELDYREIARVLKMSESATKSLLFRAYETLRDALKEFV